MGFKQAYGKRRGELFSVVSLVSWSAATVLLLSISADAAFAWSPPKHLLRQWRGYQSLIDLDADGPVPDFFVEAAAPPVAQTVTLEAAAVTAPTQGITAGSSNASAIQQIAEAAPVIAPETTPVVLPGRSTTHIIEQVIEPQLIPAQQIVYAPVSHTVIQAIQNITNQNLINILQLCGSLCTQYADVDALAISAPVQQIIGLSSNNGNVTQIGSSIGSGSGATGSQSINSSPQATTDVNAAINASNMNIFGLIQGSSGSGGVQSASVSAQAFGFPTSIINAGSNNQTSIFQAP